jgi:hypothetical protein
MKNTQRGSASVVVIIILVLIIIAGGAYFIWHQQQESNAQINTFNNQFATSTVANNPASSQSVSQNSQSSNSAQEQDCGTIINTPANSGTSTPQALKNTAAYQCMSVAVLDCSPATLTVPVPIQVFSPTPVANPSDQFQNKTFVILQSTANYCPVEQKSDEAPPYSMTCNIPNSLLNSVGQELKAKNAMQYLFNVVQFAFSSSSTPATEKPQIQDPQTKQLVHIQCSDTNGSTWFSS